MENACERGSRLRSVSEKCWVSTNYYSGKEAILHGSSRLVQLCLGHTKKLQKESPRRCCFPSENACKQTNNLPPCPQRIVTVALNLENYQGVSFLCPGHQSLVDEVPLFTNHALQKPPTTRKVCFFCTQTAVKMYRNRSYMLSFVLENIHILYYTLPYTFVDKTYYFSPLY